MIGETMNKELIREAIKLLQRALDEGVNAPPSSVATLRWGAKVSPTFKERVIWIGQDLGFDPNWLMDCMAFESAESFRADIRNGAGSGATGLIQFMPKTAEGLGTTTAALARMTPEDQLNFVWKYFSPYKGKIKNIEDLYMAILWPKGVGKPADYVLWTKAGSPTTYGQNKGLDINRDNIITKAEASAKIREKTARGELNRG